MSRPLKVPAPAAGALAPRQRAAAHRVASPGSSAAAADSHPRSLAQRRRIESAFGPAAVARGGTVVQRAIGFEFEFGEWITRHVNDGTALAKGEPIIDGAGFKVEGEDAAGRSTIEVVTKPFADDATAAVSVGVAQQILADMSQTDRVTADHFGGSANVEVQPVGDKGKFQASPAVALDKIGDLFREGSGQSYKGFADSVHQTLNSSKTRKKYLGGKRASPALEGFVMLVVNYMEQGANSFGLNYPKAAFKIMARTSFDKMFSMVPEHAFFGQPENRELWVGLVMSVAKKIPSISTEISRTEFQTNWRGKPKLIHGNVLVPAERERSENEMLDTPVLGMDLREMDKLPADVGSPNAHETYRSNITRRAWLSQMPEEDLLSKANDKRFEGMGSYGNATDVEVSESEIAELGGQVVERALPSLPVELPGSDADVDSDSEPLLRGQEVDLPAPKEAPLFELRGLSDMFGVEQNIGLDGWAAKVAEVFKIVDHANAEKDKKGRVTRPVHYGAQGKPTVAPDVDNPGIWDKKD